MGDVVQFPRERATYRLVTMRELQELLGGSPRWWTYKVAEGLPRVRWGKGSFRYDPFEVQEWLMKETDDAA